MKTRDMVRMLNQIADFYIPYTQSEAVAGIEKHVHAFWDPRMREQLRKYMEDGGKGLAPVVVTALTNYFSKTKPKSKPAPAGAVEAAAKG